MRLSEAILLGSTISEPCHSILKIEYTDGRMATCALGSAGLAIGDCSYGGVEQAFPWTLDDWRRCPECSNESSTFPLIHHLNDAHCWTRERIAEWVATIEPKEEPEAVEISCGGAREGVAK